jgi:hypothetical protein
LISLRDGRSSEDIQAQEWMQRCQFMSTKWMDPKNFNLKTKYVEILHFLMHVKQPGDLDTTDVLFIKGQLRREEARAACRFMGVKPENIHFLDLLKKSLVLN